MKQFKKTPITKERLLSIGFEEVLNNSYSYTTSVNTYIDIQLNLGRVIFSDYMVEVVIDREFKTMEEIKELITGLTGKRL